MTPSTPSTRRVVSITMQQELYEQLRQHCQQIDQPVTVFVREAIKKALDA
jgi:predicted DNA-binding protein